MDTEKLLQVFALSAAIMFFGGLIRKTLPGPVGRKISKVLIIASVVIIGFASILNILTVLSRR
ncbi:MAG: hypothetical protein UX26_C0022G0008 [Parcubacteria group bacterium GW2011_GWC1_45_9]|nr:MAG: hypothetical protein UX26_C0022G0008 [Parcubacteria group bacterium GW2011_GWC1_45_9]